MFEFLIDVMKDGTQDTEHVNLRFPVAHSDILDAERRIGQKFPEQLRAFFGEIGCGFLQASQKDASRTRSDLYYINRFLDPDEIAVLYLGEDEALIPSEGFAPGVLPFFEIGDQLYLVMKGEKVCWPFGDVICDSLLSFVTRLAENPRFYHDIPRS